MQMFMGLQIIVDNESMSEIVEDWSDVRSPSRAKRRMKRGFKQRVTYHKIPKKEILKFGDKLIMHINTLAELKKKANEWSQGSYLTNDLSLRSRPESKSPKHDFGGDFFRESSSLFSYSERIYRRDELRQETTVF